MQHVNFPYIYILQDLEPYEQLEKLKQSKSELLLKIAALKQQIVDIETQENEAIREVNHSGLAEIENVNTIDECRSKLVRNRVSIAICRLTGDKWQMKTLSLAIFYLRSAIVKSVFDCHISGVQIQKVKVTRSRSLHLSNISMHTIISSRV